MRKSINESGQALVLVLLSLAVVVTIVLFVLSRSVTDIAVSDSESQSVSAFSAAEAGVERTLVVGSNSGDQFIGDATYNAQVTNVASNATSFVYPIELNSGDTMTLWLKSQDASPNYSGTAVRICWGKAGTLANGSAPAIEASVFYEPSGTAISTRVYRITADPYSARGNSFGGTSVGNIGSLAFPFCSTVSLSGLANPQFISIRMFYNTTTSQPIGFDSTTAAVFPTQGITIDSSGTSGQSSRKVQVFQGWPEVPGPFLSGLYSTSDLSK